MSHVEASIASLQGRLSKRVDSVLVAGDRCSISQDLGLGGMILDMVLPGELAKTMKSTKALFRILTITAALTAQVQGQKLSSNLI